MTVAQLRALLAKYPADMQVMVREPDLSDRAGENPVASLRWFQLNSQTDPYLVVES